MAEMFLEGWMTLKVRIERSGDRALLWLSLEGLVLWAYAKRRGDWIPARGAGTK